ncbi:MAG: AMP-binding protein [bacterium]
MKKFYRIEECRSLSDILRFQALRYPEQSWLYDGNVGKSYTFKIIDDMVDKAVSFFKQKKCLPGEIISTVIDNRFEYIIIFLAAHRLGLIFNPFPFNLNAQDVHKYLNYIEPKLVFCQDKHFCNLKSKGWPVELIADKERGNIFLEALQVLNKSDIKDFAPLDNETACIYYSSGTTGNPKGIMYSHRNIIENISSVVRGFGWGRQDNHLVILPLGHTAAINYSFLPCLYSGARIVLFESFWKIRNNFWKYVEEFNITYIEVVPSILFSIVNTSYNDYEKTRIKQLKYIGCGSAPLPLEIQKKMEEKYQLKVANLYGLSETGPTHIDNPLEFAWKPGSIGRPLDVNNVIIVNDNGEEVQDGVVGEISVSGLNVFTGYYKNNAAYKEVFNNGYFLTGDLGYRDSKGIFYFTERKKDLIIKGGVNIFPGEIDEVIFAHPLVKESLTVGISHQYLGELIKSYIVVKEGKNLDEDEIKIFCRDRLGEFKSPDQFIFVDDIPKGPSGKLLRRRLKEYESSKNQNI